MIEQLIETLKNKDKLKLASELLQVFEEEANSLQQFDLLGKLYHDVKDYKNALKCVEKCKNLTYDKEALYSINCNLIKIYNEINEPNKALELIDQNLEINENDISMLMEKNFSYFLLNRKKDSEDILRSILLRDDITQEIRSKVLFNLGTYDLEAGKLQEGLRGFILAGKEIGIWPQDGIPKSLLLSDNNQLKSGDKLLIKADGGIGDELINIRFMKILKDRGIDATWLTSRKDLKDLFNFNGYKTITYEDFRNQSYFDYDKCSTSMSLPIWLNLSEEELYFGDYLKYFDESKEKFNFMKNDKIKIGLRWSGNPYYEQNLHRDLNFNDLYNLVKEIYPDAEIYSLQFPKDQTVNYRDVIDLSDKIENYSDTLSIIDNLDFVISSCTNIPHGCGSISKECYVLPPISAYYIWDSPHKSREPNESIWYNKNMKVLKQSEHKSWTNELNELKKLLQKRVNATTTTTNK